MKYVNLGRTGLKVSRLCIGCMSYGRAGIGPHDWTLDEEATRPLFRRSIEAGINFFDTANAYAAGTSEEIVGRLLREFSPRDEVVVATKVHGAWRNAPNTSGLSRKAIFNAIDDSLRRLGMDYVDLYQIHRWDHATPIEETMEALHDVVKAGKARYIGASSMYAWQFLKALDIADRHGWTRFISMQNHLNLLYREEEREMLPLCTDQEIGVMPWSPLARGRLTRDWDEKTPRSERDLFGRILYDASADNDRRIVEAVGEVAAECQIPRAQVALSWLLDKPGVVSPIIGVTKPRHLDDAVAAMEVHLSAEQRLKIEAPYLPHKVSGMGSEQKVSLHTTLLLPAR